MPATYTQSSGIGNTTFRARQGCPWPKNAVSGSFPAALPPRQALA
ncbi:hypothetical protein [Desulfovibrio sp. ZJ200]|nr:hypothetical protein [Desulfovibrio sp. ZJ200]